MQVLSKVYAKKLVSWAKDKPKVVVLSADLTSSTEADLFRDAYPDRFYSMGIAEQNMLSFAGGLAREGFFPFVHTFAVFIYRRAFDQVAMSISYPNVPVRMVGFLPGITTPGGATHQAIEDIGVLRTLPNMTIIEVGDATEIETVLDPVQRVAGPVYLRMLRGEVPRLFPETEPFCFNKARVLSSGGTQPEVTLFSSGICTEEAMRAAAALKAKGLSLRHLHISTLKPFSDPLVKEAIEAARKGVITMENHTIIGGLGSAVAECMAEMGAGKPLVRIGLNDTHAHGASKAYLMREYHIDALALVAALERLLNARFDLTENDLAAVRIEAVHSQAKAEAL